MKRIVVALGGNALGSSPIEQLLLAKNTAHAIVDLIAEGNEVIITHGNGPQVGMINLAFETASKTERKVLEMPFPECGAMSQGYIGFHLQNALQEEIRSRGLKNKVATVVTQVEVDKEDQAFMNPTKPIGAFYPLDVANTLIKEKGYIMREDAGRGYRRVVASPKPINVIEIDIIKTLVQANHSVITVGGGGIPVIRLENQLVGVDAVIDKDFASAYLAQELDADYLFILTAVDKVSLNFGKENQIDLDSITVKEANEYIEEGHFGKGSMLPKVQAAISFAKSSNGKVSIIASLEKAALALQNKAGTKITL